ncbi:uncharacterized protein LOC135145187 isoform X2 [Zophobas morio]|jgi:hypothetical protein
MASAQEWRKVFTKRLNDRDAALKKLPFAESSLSEKTISNETNEMLEFVRASLNRGPSASFILTLYLAISFLASLVVGNIKLISLFEVMASCGDHEVKTGKNYDSLLMCQKFEKLFISGASGYLNFPFLKAARKVLIKYEDLNEGVNISFPSLKELELFSFIGTNQPSISISVPRAKRFEKIRIEGLSSDQKDLDFGTLELVEELKISNSAFELINLSSLRIVERLIFSKVSFNLLKAPKLETVMKLDANELYSNKPIQLQLNNLMECDTFSVMSSKVLDSLSLPSLKSTKTFYLDQIEFSNGSLELPSLQTTAVFNIMNIKNLQTVNLSGAVNIERVLVLHTMGIRKFSSSAQEAQYLGFIENMDLTGIQLPFLTKAEISLDENMLIKSLSLPSLESGEVLLKNCDKIEELFIPRFNNGGLALISNPELSTLNISNFKKTTAAILFGCPKIKENPLKRISKGNEPLSIALMLAIKECKLETSGTCVSIYETS